MNPFIEKEMLANDGKDLFKEVIYDALVKEKLPETCLAEDIVECMYKGILAVVFYRYAEKITGKKFLIFVVLLKTILTIDDLYLCEH